VLRAIAIILRESQNANLLKVDRLTSKASDERPLSESALKGLLRTRRRMKIVRTGCIRTALESRSHRSLPVALVRTGLQTRPNGRCSVGSREPFSQVPSCCSCADGSPDPSEREVPGRLARAVLTGPCLLCSKQSFIGLVTIMIMHKKNASR
jgi:hypothetical protein